MRRLANIKLAAVVACFVELLHLTPSTPSPVAPWVALLAGLVVGHIGFAQQEAA